MVDSFFLKQNLIYSVSLSPFVHQQLFNCQLLHRLSMPDNDVTVLPAAIANLVNLRELDVSKNSKQNLPPPLVRVLLIGRFSEPCNTEASDQVAETRNPDHSRRSRCLLSSDV